MRRFLGDTDQSDIVLCEECAEKRKEPGSWAEEPGGTCDICCFNEQAAICVLCRRESHHYQPYRDVPRFAFDQTRPWQAKWDKFLGLTTVNICRECRVFGFAPVYAASDWVELSNAREWLRPNLDFTRPPAVDIEELRCRHLTGF